MTRKNLGPGRSGRAVVATCGVVVVSGAEHPAAAARAYGLCRIYANEPWHYELRPDAIGRGCPAMYADPTQDPRMQQR